MAGIVSVERLAFSHTAGAGSANITKGQTLAKCMPWFTRRTTVQPGDNSNWAYHSVHAQMSSAPNKVETSSLTGATLAIEASIMAFGAGVNVYEYDFQIAEGDDTDVVTLSPTVTLANTFMRFSYKSASYPGGHTSLTAVGGRISATNSLTFERKHQTLTTTDIVFSGSSGSSTVVTSTLEELPDMQAGDKFTISGHPTNDDTYTVTTRTTGSANYTVTAGTITPGDDATERSVSTKILGPQIDGTAYLAESVGGADWTVQHENYTMDNGVSELDHTITSVTEAKTFLIVDWSAQNTAANDNNRLCPYAYLQSPTNVRSRRQTANTDIALNVQVVSFAGGGAEVVQRGLLTVNAPDTDVDDLEVVQVSGSQADLKSDTNNTLPTMAPGDRFWINQATGTDNQGWWTVDTWTSSSLLRATRDSVDAVNWGPAIADIEEEITGAEAPADVSITAVDLSVAIAQTVGPQSHRQLWAGGTNQNAIPTTYHSAKFTTTTNLQLQRFDSSPSERVSEAAWEVIEWEIDTGGAPPRRIFVT